MKKAVLSIAAFLILQQLFCQQNDSVRIAKDTLVEAPEPKTETAVPAKVRKDTRPVKDRIAFGFGSSFWITPSQTYVELAPVLAYRFPKTLITGIGYKYIYRHQRLVGQNLNSYGPNVFARVNLLKRVYLWNEYELLTNEYLLELAGQEISKNKAYTDSWFAGLGYVRSFGKKSRGGISVQILFNILYNRDDVNPYYGPVTYRVGYYF